MRKKQKIFAIIKIIVASIIFYSIFTAINSYSFLLYDDATDRFSRIKFHQFVASYFPKKENKRSAVVLVTDQSIKHFDSFPLKFSTHAYFLNAIASYSPSAIFIDFTFIDNREDLTLPLFVKALEKIARSGVTLVIAENPSADGPRILPELAALTEFPNVHLASIVLGEGAQSEVYYVRSSMHSNTETAAFSIARETSPTSYNASIDIEAFDIWWGYPPSKINCIRAGSECPLVSSLGRMQAWLGFNFTETSKNHIPLSQPFNPYFFADEFLNGANRPIISPIINKNVVFYGPNFSIVGDQIPNPVFSYRSNQNVIPGVFVHAMAYENIINLGSQLKINNGGDWLKWVPFTIYLIAIFYFAGTGERPKQIILIPMAFISSFCIAVFGFYYLDYGAGNWLGSVGEAAAAMWLLGLINLALAYFTTNYVFWTTK